MATTHAHREGINLVASGVCVLVLLWIIFCSSPTAHRGPKPKPAGLRNALMTKEFAVLGYTAFVQGWAFNGNMLLMILTMKDV